MLSLLKTNRKNLSADELWRIYTLLTRAENAFRDAKTPLAIRPIFHHLEPRTDTTYFSLRPGLPPAHRHRKSPARPRHPHLLGEPARATLGNPPSLHRHLPTDNGSSLRIRKAATPDPDVQQIYRNLRISPHVIIPKYTWTQPTHSD